MKTTTASAPSATADQSRAQPTSPDMRRVVIASSLGNALEIYDFTVYSFFAAIIGKLFFPSDSASPACCCRWQPLPWAF